MGGLWLVVLAMGCHLATSSLLDCTFENSTCGYTVLKDQRPGLFDVMEWRLGQATEKQQYYDLKLLTYGPDVDHTSAQPYGSLMYAVRPINPNTNTTLLSPVTSGRLCYFEFFYHMGSRSLKNITTYVVKYGQWIKLGTFTGYQGYEWNRALYDIEEYTRFGEYQLAIVATEPDSASWTIGYALDDLRGMECNMPISCDFEADMCDFEVERDYYYYDRMEWLRGQASIATWFGKVKLLRNGPDADHTKNTTAGYFAYAQKPLSSHTNTTLVSPKQTRQLCWLEFYYFMAHPDLGSLNVYLRKDEAQFLLWQAKGNQGAKWNRALIDLERDTASGSYELAIFASEPTSQFYSIGYAIDDVNAYECACANSPCLNGGSCHNLYKSYNCSCPLFFSGKHCEHDDNPCHTNPCKNGATCTPYSPSNYTCVCRPGWTGATCEVDIDECASQPCANGGLCINGLDVFDCFCDPGWTGERCETEIDECASGPCFNGGTCTDRFNGFNCSCLPGFTGTQCDVNVDECASSPCQHGSFCFDQVDGYLCICLKEYTGTHCEVRRTLDCDFERDQCGYKVSPVVGDNATDIEWTRGPVSSPSLFGNTKVMLFGPNSDHSTGTPGGFMMYAKDGGPDNVTTTMTSPLSEGELCYLQFFFHMGSSSLGRLTVDILPQNGSAKRIFSSTGFHGFEWNRAQVDIERETVSGKYQFRFEVQEPAGMKSGVGYGIDDIRGLSCNMDMACDFEDDLCNYYVEMNNGQYYDAMEWRRGQPTLETVFSSIKLLRNGPDTDHTTNSKEGWFMYALKPVNNGTTTMLVAPRQRRQYCYMAFWYHMGSAQLNNLTAAVRKDNETIEVFRASGYQGNMWNQAVISIEDATREGRYELVIEADQPDGMFWTVGYAVDDIDVKPCLCELTPCMNGGTCHNTFGSFMCQCPYLFGGDDCSLRRQPCDYVPCQHGATCANIPTDDYNCTCSPGWQGKNCEVNIDECVSFPCENGGTCVDGVNAFTCDCASGFYGDRCQFNVDECISRPCLNGAVCVDGIDSFTCECAGGFFGVFCQFEVNECESAPCQNNGTCIDDVNFYSCNCVQGYTGVDCEQEVDECVSGPCQHGSMCVDKLAGFDCFCTPGYTGSLCQQDVNECWSNPCLNGASCRNLVNSLQCDCAQGFTGELCETEIDECLSQPCQHGGTCEDQVGAFLCHCSKDYTGDTCQKSLATDCGLDPCG